MEGNKEIDPRLVPTTGTDSNPSELGSTRVVAAVVWREGQLLVCQRPHDKRHGGLWEFNLPRCHRLAPCRRETSGPRVPAARSWHPFRRRWATERKHLSPKDVAAVGGWVDTTTLQRCYQQADDETMEAVVMQPKRLRKLG